MSKSGTLRRFFVNPLRLIFEKMLMAATYTNTENHPGVIGLRSAAEKRRRAEARAQAEAAVPPPRGQDEDEESDSGSETEREEPRVTVARPKGETAEEKKARKAAVKAERSVSIVDYLAAHNTDIQSRRAEKKAHTATFGEERKKQLATHKKMVGGGRAADVTVGARGVVSLR